MLKVAKFGGSSMADAEQFKKVRAIIESDDDRKVIVVSAAGKRYPDDHKLTDLLYLCHAHLTYGVSAGPVFDMVKDRYLSIRDTLGISLDLESDFEKLYQKMQKGISQDELVSRGEYFSAKLLAAYLGYEFIDSANWVRFNYDGTVDQTVSYQLLREMAAGKRAVIPGFYGTMEDGKIRLMDRGGSDITGAYVAAALNADIYENWTDVSGILMADPRIVKDAKTIARVTYSELRELSYIGAQVLHEATIFPVREKNIPVNIRNTNDPENPGTLIRDNFEGADPDDASLITGIAGKKGFITFSITRSGMASESGTLRKILMVFEKYNVPIHYILNGIDCATLVVRASSVENCRYLIQADLNRDVEPDHIHVSDNIAIIAIVGRKMASRSGSSGKIFQALGEQNINVRMISQGPEELNIMIGVKEKDFNITIDSLYHKFVG
ncbi:MAG: aspartate kinase [Lachnospiraceae bacterium]|nr:aspartate kinase [Lachnospiraceae bacterium]